MVPIKVLISDFQFLTREGLINLINKDDEMDLVAVVEGPEDLMETVLTHLPQVVVLDYQSQDPILLSLLKQVVSSQVANVLIITNDSDRRHIQALLDIGIKGIVTKGCSKIEIVNAIHAVSKNNRFFCNKVLDLLMDQKKEDDAVNCEPTDLSAREYEVLTLITKGFKTVQIADELNVSVHTINSHRKNILKKLGMKSPAELIVYALESGLVKA